MFRPALQAAEQPRNRNVHPLASPFRDERTQPTAFALTEVKWERWNHFCLKNKGPWGGTWLGKHLLDFNSYRPSLDAQTKTAIPTIIRYTANGANPRRLT